MNGRSELADEKTEWLRRFHILYNYSWGLLRSNVQLNERVFCKDGFSDPNANHRLAFRYVR